MLCDSAGKADHLSFPGVGALTHTRPPPSTDPRDDTGLSPRSLMTLSVAQATAEQREGAREEPPPASTLASKASESESESESSESF